MPDANYCLAIIHSGVRLDSIMSVWRGSSLALDIGRWLTHDTDATRDISEHAECETECESERIREKQIQNNSNGEATILNSFICKVWVVALAILVPTMLSKIILRGWPDTKIRRFLTAARELAQKTADRRGDPQMKFHYEASLPGKYAALSAISFS